MKISDEILAILSKCAVEGNILFLPQEQLDRKIYLTVNKCLINIGGKWDRKAKGHVFDHDPSDDLDSMLLTGETVDMKKAYQFFPTPTVVAEQMCGMAELDANCVVLEPSCGRGDLADVIYAAGVADPLGVELNLDMRRYLMDKPYRTEVGVDFLQFAEDAENQGTFARIVMNPPFSKHQDVDHILAAYKLLVPCGILVSVSSPSPFWRTDRKSVEFQNWILDVNAQVVDVPEGAFKESGTMLRTKIIKARKEAATTYMARDRNISAIVWLEDRDTIFFKWLAEDAAALCDAGFSLAETRRMLATLSYVRVWSANPPWLFPIRGLPKGYRWRDGYKFSQRAGRKSDGYSYMLLSVGEDLYIKGLIAVGTKITDYPGAKIKGYKRLTCAEVLRGLSTPSMLDGALQTFWKAQGLPLGYVVPYLRPFR